VQSAPPLQAQPAEPSAQVQPPLSGLGAGCGSAMATIVAVGFCSSPPQHPQVQVD